jgi:hypothetical protein
MRVIHWVHDATPNMRPLTAVTGTAGFTETDVSRFGVTDFSDGGVAFTPDHADFLGGEADGNVIAFFGYHLGETAGSPHHLTTATGDEFDVMNFCP